MKGQFFPIRDENVSDKTPYMTYSLILVNVLVFICSLFDFSETIKNFGYIPARAAALTAMTSMFLHGDVMHIAMNMWYLHVFGDNIESAFGSFKFLLFYIFSGLAAALVHHATNFNSVIPVIGASGAVSGILGAYFVLYPHVKIKAIGFYSLWTLPTSIVIGSWFALQLIYGFLSLSADISDIAFWAHLGGFLFGALAGLVFNKVYWGELTKKYDK